MIQKWNNHNISKCRKTTIIHKWLHLSVKYYIWKVCHYLEVVIINKLWYDERVYNFHQIMCSLICPYYLQEILEKAQVDHYVILFSEIPTTRSYDWQNINICIKNHVICGTTMNWNSYRVTIFQSTRLPNTALINLLTVIETLVSFILWNCGNIQSTPS